MHILFLYITIRSLCLQVHWNSDLCCQSLFLFAIRQGDWFLRRMAFVHMMPIPRLLHYLLIELPLYILVFIQFLSLLPFQFGELPLQMSQFWKLIVSWWWLDVNPIVDGLFLIIISGLYLRQRGRLKCHWLQNIVRLWLFHHFCGWLHGICLGCI